MSNHFDRRSFIKKSLFAAGGAAMITIPFVSCDNDEVETKNTENASRKNFNEGIASFDPTSSSVIIWTRYTTNFAGITELYWELSTDSNFTQIIRTGSIQTDESKDYTAAIDIQNLKSNLKLYYRFFNTAQKEVSEIGETITLPSAGDNVPQVKMAVCSCANFAAGLFNVYEAMANSDVDVIVHLGDYIYEYGAGQYGTNANTLALGRTHVPANEIITLQDYRARYKQYRRDAKLKLAHQKKPFIAVWDDHEITNDTYKDGAENHQLNEGSFSARKQSALKAYSEYIPLKTGANPKIYRSFEFGNLVALHMLDTRVIARDKQLDYANYFTASGFNAAAFQTDLLNPSRKLLGNEQLSWLANKVATSTQKWQVLGQQVLMTKMLIPADLLLSMSAILAEIDATGSARPQTLAAFQTTLTQLVTIKMRMLQNDPTLTATEKARINITLPYNLDAWDGYPIERETLFAALAGKKVISLAGDTHNGWQGSLIEGFSGTKTQVGTEFATASVTSPGLETYLGIGAGASAQIAQFQEAFALLIDDLHYADVSKRGYLKVTYTQGQARADWFYVTSTSTDSYSSNMEFTKIVN
jgi:alkaline phosphatase D